VEGRGFIPNKLFAQLLLGKNAFNGGEGNNLFVNAALGAGPKQGRYCKIKSKKAFDFLKKYSNDNTFPVVYLAGMEVERSEVGIAEPLVVKPTPPAPPKEDEDVLKPGGNTTPKSLKVEDEQKELEVKDQVAQIEENKK